MLEALAAKKDGGSFEHGGEREDYITSAIFGPLQFLPTTAVWEFAKQILLPPAWKAPPRWDGSFQPSSHEVAFWPRLKHRVNRVEPDVVLTVNGIDPAHQITVAIEAKWNWKVPSNHLKEQTDQQRKALLEEQIVASDIVSVVVAKQFPPEAVPSAYCVTWAALCAFVPSPLLKAWHDLISRALARLGEHPMRPFGGFRAPGAVNDSEILAFNFSRDAWMRDQFALQDLPAASTFIAAANFPRLVSPQEIP